MPKDYQENFIKSCYDALNDFDSETLDEAKKRNENSNIRNVGFTIETKPDYCKQVHVDAMLQYGVTRVEIGVQSLQERVYEIVNRAPCCARRRSPLDLDPVCNALTQNFT